MVELVNDSGMYSEKTNNACSLCLSENTNLIFRLWHKDRVYHVVHCRDCDLIQTVEHYEDVSPEYVDLSDDQIDCGRIWCQNAHKLPAFKQWYDYYRQVNQKMETPRLLDIGCGTGGFLRFAKENMFDVYGFDSSQAQVDYARKDLPNVRRAFSIGEYGAHFENKSSNKYDAVTLWDVLEHIRKPLDILGEIRASLSENGLLFVSVPSGPAMMWKRYLYNKIPRLYKDRTDHDWLPWEHVFYYSTKSLRYYLEKSGFEVVKIGSVACYPRPLNSFEMIRRAGFKLLKYLPYFSPQIYAWARLK